MSAGPLRAGMEVKVIEEPISRPLFVQGLSYATFLGKVGTIQNRAFASKPTSEPSDEWIVKFKNDPQTFTNEPDIATRDSVYILSADVLEPI